MIHLEKPRLGSLVDEKVHAQQLEAREGVSIGGGAAAGVRVGDGRLDRDDRLDDDLLDLGPKAVHVMPVPPQLREKSDAAAGGRARRCTRLAALCRLFDWRALCAQCLSLVEATFGWVTGCAGRMVTAKRLRPSSPLPGSVNMPINARMRYLVASASVSPSPAP